MAGLLLFSSTVGYDSSLMTGLQSLSQWESFMDSPSGAWLGFISAIQSLGAMLGLPAQAWAANKFGRKPCIFVGYFFLFLGVGIQVGAHGPAMFIVSRFFIGYAGAWFQAAIVLLAEIAYPTHRSKVTAMYHCQYYVGSTLSAWLVYGCRNIHSMWAWKVPSLCQIVFPLVALPLVSLCPESPRWLISKDRHEEAQLFLAKYHAGGDHLAPLVAFQMDEISRSIIMERESSNSTSWLDMCRTKGNRHRLFISLTLGTFAQWNGM
jgi:MFS family permease